MKRREFVTLIGGAALLPLSVRAQQLDRIYRIGVLILGANGGELDAQQRAVFTKALTELGWTEGKNIQIDWRWAANDVAQIPALARELLSLKQMLYWCRERQPLRHCSTKQRPLQSFLCQSLILY
jgi:putative ABC transport system substrate-binding protein